MHSFVFFAPSAEKNPAVPSPLHPAASAILPLKEGSAKLVPPQMYVQLNKTHEGSFLYCEGFARKHLGEPDSAGLGQEQEAEMREENG